jgi:DNA-binding transcriptional ArsR family regulator
MRALAHPVRLALLEHLGQHLDGATATECAQVVELSPSATSYHLRALAKVGMIREAPSRGDGRERVWQASYESYDIGNERGATDEEVAAEAALVETYLARQNDKVRHYLAGSRTEPADWYDASMIGEQALVLTARELKRLRAQIDELVEPLKVRNRERPPRSARPVSFQLRIFPTDTSS